MGPLTTLLLLAQDPVQAALDRHAAFIRSMNTATIAYEFKMSPNQRKGSGMILLKRPNFLRAEVRERTNLYTFIMNPQASIETLNTTKRYFSYEPLKAWTGLPGKLAPVREFFPAMVIAPNLKSLVAPGAKFAVVASQPATTVLEAKYDSQNGPVVARFTLDRAGKPLSYSESLKASSESITLTITKFEINKPIAGNPFGSRPPLGYTAEALPRETWPLTREEGFPVAQFSISGRALGEALGSAKGLVAFVSPHCSSSKQLLAWLSTQSQHLAGQGIRSFGVWTEGNGRMLAGIEPVATSAASMASMRLSGTPYLYLVNAKGAILGVWQAFDPSGKRALFKEIVAAAKESGGS